MALLEADLDYLKKCNLSFEVHNQDNKVFLVIKDYKLPETYSPNIVDLLIILPIGFPNANPDMFWTLPRVTLPGGAAPRATEATEQYLGKSWQRWSRHWSRSWRPGIDGLNTYMAAIKKELSRGY